MRLTNWLVILLTATALFLAGCGKSELSDVEHLQRAKQFQAQGDIRSSIIEFKNALQKNPDNAEARWLLGRAYLEVGDGLAAEKELSRARELGIPDTVLLVSLAQAWQLQREFHKITQEIEVIEALSETDKAMLHAIRGDAFMRQGKRDEAKQAFAAALALVPGHPDARVGQARLAALDNDLEKARRMLEEIVADHPGHAEAWSALGDVARWSRRLEDAEQAYGKAIERRFNNHSDRMKRALVRIALQRLDQAKEDIAELKKIKGAESNVSYAEGLVYFQQQRYPEAQTAFEKHLKLTPGNLAAVYYLAATHFVQNHLAQAETLLDQFLWRVPGNEVAARMAAVIKLRKRDYGAAEQLLKPLLRRNPDDLPVLNMLATAAIQQGDIERGIGYLRRVVAKQPDQGQARFRLALGLLMQGAHDEAITEIQAATELDAELVQADALLILSLSGAGKYDQAMQAVEKLKQKQPDKPLPYYLMGMIYEAQGKREQAAAAYQQALKIAPGDPAASHKLANIAAEDQDYARARSLLEEVVKRQPNHIDTVLGLAEIDLREGKVEQAVSRLQELLRQNPAAVTARALLARIYTRGGQPGKALGVLREAGERAQRHPLILMERGEAQLAMGNVDNAIATYEQLVKQQPRSSEAHYRLAMAYAAKNDSAKTQQALQTLLDIAPDHQLGNIAAVRLAMLQGREREAEQRLQALQRQWPDSEPVLRLSAWMALRQQDYPRAVEAYQRVADLYPSSANLLRLVRAQWLAGDAQAAISRLEAWLDEHRQDNRARFVLADLYHRQGRLEASRKAFQAMLEVDPDDIIALNNLAWLLKEQNPAQALVYARKAVQVAPDLPAAWDTLGVILLAQDKPQEALTSLRQGLEKVPEDTALRYHLAQALIAVGKQAEAKAVLTELLSMARDFPEREDAQALYETLQ